VRGADARNQPDAHIVANPGADDARDIAIYDRLFVGRECSGVEERHRLLIDDPSVSRNHLEIRVEADRGVAYVVDSSTNGTRLNGIRIERGVPVMLEPGDRLRIGVVDLEFRSETISKRAEVASRRTTGGVTNADFVMVVGDIVGFSTISHTTSSRVLMETLEVLLREFRALLVEHHGTLSNFVGDAFFAIWELGSDANAEHAAVEFAVAAVSRLRDVAPSLPLRSTDGGPLRMGWGLARGDAAVSSLMGTLLGVVGDSTNLAFRLSGIAARDGRSEVLLAASLYEVVAHDFRFDAVEHVHVKGRAESEPVYGLRVPFESPR
jgi:class 3 adenylate cyclase